MRRNCIFCILSAMLIVFSTQIVAQESPDLVRSISAEIIFPEVIRFSFDLTVTAADVASASLSIEIANDPAQVFELDVDASALVYEEPEARLRFILPLSPDFMPAWFDTLSYTWTAETRDGRTVTVMDEFIFTDPRVNWKRLIDPDRRYDLIIPESYERAFYDFPAMVDQLQNDSGLSPQLSWLIYPPEVPPGCEVIIQTDGLSHPPTPIAVGANGEFQVPCTTENVGLGYRGRMVYHHADQQRILDFVAFRLLEVFYRDRWSDKAVPDWFYDGLAAFYSPTSKSVLLPIAREVVRLRQSYPQQRMATRENSDQWRAQSYALIAYLLDLKGEARLVELANSIENAASFDEALFTILEVRSAALFVNLQQWLFSNAAETAFSYSVYTTRLLPTFTPSASASATLTPSPIATQSSATPTRVPSLTPSRTPLPPSPTITPRPPGSLMRPTAVSIATPVVVNEVASTRLIVIGLLVVLLAILVVLLLRTGNRS